jgi:phosphatidylglycerophosphatase C
MQSDSSYQKPVVAAFDFDGTMTVRDSLFYFLLHSTSSCAAFKKFAALSPVFFGYLAGFCSRQYTKERVLTHFFAGMPLKWMRDLGASFSASAELNKLVRPPAMQRLEWHLRQGHRCILVSASIDLYLEPWGKQTGFHDVIASRIEVDPSGAITGRLSGLNCWGAEKLRRLEQLLGPHSGYVLYAYGDSRGDKELLAAAEYPFFRHMPVG